MRWTIESVGERVMEAAKTGTSRLVAWLYPTGWGEARLVEMTNTELLFWSVKGCMTRDHGGFRELVDITEKHLQTGVPIEVTPFVSAVHVSVRNGRAVFRSTKPEPQDRIAVVKVANANLVKVPDPAQAVVLPELFYKGPVGGPEWQSNPEVEAIRAELRSAGSDLYRPADLIKLGAKLSHHRAVLYCPDASFGWAPAALLRGFTYIST